MAKKISFVKVEVRGRRHKSGHLDIPLGNGLLDGGEVTIVAVGHTDASYRRETAHLKGDITLIDYIEGHTDVV